MNSSFLTLMTIFISAFCAIAGIIVNRHISLRQIKNQESNVVLTNAEYWRKEVETFQTQITELRNQLREAESKIEEQTKDIELLTFKYYQVMVEKQNVTEQMEQYKNRSIRNPIERNRKQPRYGMNDNYDNDMDNDS